MADLDDLVDLVEDDRRLARRLPELPAAKVVTFVGEALVRPGRDRGREEAHLDRRFGRWLDDRLEQLDANLETSRVTLVRRSERETPDGLELRVEVRLEVPRG